jgi:hypothetical protein
MLIKPTAINCENGKEEEQKLSPSSFTSSMNREHDFTSGVLDEHIGRLRNGETKHFYSFGNFNSMRLIFHILKTTGPASILMSSYGISPKTIAGILGRMEQGIIKDFRLIIDNRVRSISPKPFDMIVRSFNYRCTSIHAKVACIYNGNWKVTLISSQNATDNPKAERGIIYTDPDVFDFDFKTLSDVFNRGTK